MLSKALKNEAKGIYNQLTGIKDILISPQKFSLVTIHRNNIHYKFPLQVGQLITAQTAIEERNGNYFFQDFDRNHHQMARLFESFVRRFYMREQKRFKVSRENIEWRINESESTGNLALIPKMQTDISLISPERKIIIDTKFYLSAYNSRYDSPKLHSSHLYQLYSYLCNLEEQSLSRNGGANKIYEGILLYPKNGIALDESYKIGSHRIKIYTINLEGPWQDIHDRLISLLD
ncbi:5-methylcytosine-specific restriction enzyme McrBC, subunit McrC [Pedobacter sp. BAL39]|uniref:5-methylcytosine restriction system specificity protein McrC n=1 Tax=Pedobacter sp. BAL39 TaxID=391596 RepID=UPI000155A159|nr:5-methylcytosine-specific restriction enzyme McrBC, subunit McrC [Pedobacter sp. BAL39]EDM35346.1 5-methylcytosine-specific restriction enzyme McrBC, subunit McrC [Pedobacter sp. BAL39]